MDSANSVFLDSSMTLPARNVSRPSSVKLETTVYFLSAGLTKYQSMGSVNATLSASTWLGDAYPVHPLLSNKEISVRSVLPSVRHAPTPTTVANARPVSYWQVLSVFKFAETAEDLWYSVMMGTQSMEMAVPLLVQSKLDLLVMEEVPSQLIFAKETIPLKAPSLSL